MSTGKSTVIEGRFAKGFTYKDFLAQIKVNKDQFEKYYGTVRLSDDDITFLRRACQARNGVAKVLVLGEDWCPDVFRGLPVVQRIAEAAGLELRIFPRDANLDIMNEFLNQGKFQSIPVFVFYTKDLKYICHFTERPAQANEERAKIEAEIKKEMPNASEQDFRLKVREKTQARYPDWQKATVREIKQMLSEKLKV